ncbi:MAG TPA: calcium/sodium antiporter [Opitutaceae bacterium]|nr:calcium/sodium antiporter [Opitutaceae bacterium]HRJ48132.1 calcium/sodium antiporter [Opitutaceae bacterium]
MNIILALSAGFVLLVAGGELLVRGAVRMAERLGMSPLLVGLTIVGFGTSTPELVTSVQAAMQGSPGIAVGNIVGSNIANILLILGLAALISPITLTPAALRRDGVLVLVTAVMFAVVAWAWTLDRATGCLLVAGLAGYLTYAYRQEKQATPSHTAAFDKGEALDELVTHHPKRHARSKALDLAIAIALVAAGLVLVVLGGKYFVTGAIGLARSFEISETVIGLTIVAIGTSMPELVTSVVAAYRKHSDVALGNVLGSNLYNVLGIGGLTALISPTEVPAAIVRFDNPVMIAASAALLLFAWTNRRIGRREGGLLLAGYAAYVLALVF